MAEAGGGEGTRAARALTDGALVQALRAGEMLAVAEFVSRFTPLLESYALRTGIPRSDWDVCIQEVLEDEAMRLMTPTGSPPRSLAAYLVAAVRHRWLKVRRGELRRARREGDLFCGGGAPIGDATPVLRALCSAHSLRVSEGPELAEPSRSSAVELLATRVAAELSEQDLLLLTWVAEGVSRRQIAEWLGVGYEAARKRVLRLAHRVRDLAATRAATLDAVERAEVVRRLPRPAAARARGAVGEGEGEGEGKGKEARREAHDEH